MEVEGDLLCLLNKKAHFFLFLGLAAMWEVFFRKSNRVPEKNTLGVSTEVQF